MLIFQDSLINKKFLFIIGEIVIIDIIRILWPIKMFFGLLYWNKMEFVVHLNSFIKG